MNVFETIRTILAVRSFKSDPIPPVSLRRILQAGQLTGSSMNLQPWHFIAVQQPETIQALAKIATTGPYIRQAPLAVVVLIEKDSRYSLSDASRAIQSMVLAAWAEGIGSNWVGFFNLEAVKPLLGIPVHLDVLAILPFGYPDQPAGEGIKKRKPFDQVVSAERYGKPLDPPTP